MKSGGQVGAEQQQSVQPAAVAVAGGGETEGLALLPLARSLSTSSSPQGMTRLGNPSQGGRSLAQQQTTVNSGGGTAELCSHQTNSTAGVGRKRRSLLDEILILPNKLSKGGSSPSTSSKEVDLRTRFGDRSNFLSLLDNNSGAPSGGKSSSLFDINLNQIRPGTPRVPGAGGVQAESTPATPAAPPPLPVVTAGLSGAAAAATPGESATDELTKLLQAQNNSLLQSALTAGNRLLPDVSSSGGGEGTESQQQQPPPPSQSCPTSSSPTKELPGAAPTQPPPPPSAPDPSLCTTTTASPTNNQEQIVEKAKQEAYVMQRIGELQKDGLWAERRLPKVHELPRSKAHWDYLLEEMAWLAADFAQERKWKKAAAKKCARMVQKHFQEKEALAQKAIKAQELQLKRIAAFISREIKSFWNNVEKLVEFKQKTRLEAKRKKALDQHLSFIVDQTEKFSSLVAEGLNTSSRPVSPKAPSDVEFEPEGSSEDDEETIAKEEALDRGKGSQEEIEALRRESQLPLEDLLSDYLEKRDSLGSPPSSQKDEGEGEDEEVEEETDDAEYKGSDDPSDDEETIQEQEKTEGEVNHRQEIHDLEEEGSMSIEQLKAKYGIQELPTTTTDSKPKPVNGDTSGGGRGRRKRVETESEGEESGEEGEGSSSEEEEEGSESEEEEEGSGGGGSDGGREEEEEGSALKTLLNDLNDSEKVKGDKDQEMNDVAALAQSLQPKGNTLSSTSVVTKVPFLLKHTLREYQHIGLDWLVTMYERKLNGILADEMGLGKTIQTIALIAHLACEKGNWGPHLIIVPTSVMLNWEMEFKKWCPAFKILTYYGTIKERKMKRSGWTKPNAFHICITSYKLVIQDHQSFRRKKWKYLILDEAQNIKNFKSQRWQLLLNFQTQRRLLLTGTPLQNNLMELWSLMHFLMPTVFESHKEFKEWFSNPLTGMIEGSSEYNESIIKRLHKVLRPFLLRRLKSEVETQMPKKYEHIVMCRLSNRQRYLYDDFMSRAKTKETLASGSLLSVINVLMQLRKVCNHPNLFEVRPTVSPFQMEAIHYHVPSLVYSALDPHPLESIDLMFLNLRLIEFELWLLALVAHKVRLLKTPAEYIREIDSQPPPPPPPPRERIKITLKKRILSQSQAANPVRQVVQLNNHRISLNFPAAKVGTSPLIKVGQNNPQGQLTLRLAAPGPGQLPNYLHLLQPANVKALSAITSLAAAAGAAGGGGGGKSETGLTPVRLPQFAQLVNTPSGRQFVLSPQPVITPTGAGAGGGQQTQRIVVTKQTAAGTLTKLVSPVSKPPASRPIMRVPPLNIPPPPSQQQPSATNTTTSSSITNCVTAGSSSSSVAVNEVSTTNGGAGSSPSKRLTTARLRTTPLSSVSSDGGGGGRGSNSGVISSDSPTKGNSGVSSREEGCTSSSGTDLRDEELEELRRRLRREKLSSLARVNDRRCSAQPVYGGDLTSCCLRLAGPAEAVSGRGTDRTSSQVNWRWTGYSHCSTAASSLSQSASPRLYWTQTQALSSLILSIEDRVQQMAEIFSRFVLWVPAVASRPVRLSVPHPPPWKSQAEERGLSALSSWLRPKLRLLHVVSSNMSTQFPDRRLIQYDCGKLQALDRLLRTLKAGHHRVLIFTQMTRMLDVLEAFLNFHGHIYLRLDGTTKVDQRQMLMERFNADRRIFCFILSTRSGGVGINLTGADTVIFYDSDWNPTMDAQAQDRCHRIGQTRDVHIYRLVSEKTVEENILKKANQKRMLGDVAIEGGNFTTAQLKSSTIQDLFNVDTNENDASRRMAEVLDKDVSRSQTPNERQQSPFEENKAAMGALENALAEAEDETDVAAARVAKAEAAAELAEFDENIPLLEAAGAGGEGSGAAGGGGPPELSRAELELNALMEQLNGVEKYAIRFMEETEAVWSKEQLAAAEAEIEQQKREWEAGRLAALRDGGRRGSEPGEDSEELTYSGVDARNQLWVSNDGREIMPMWCPPTPPSEEGDVYIDQSLTLLYQSTVIPEAALPPVYVKKEKKRSRFEAGLPEGGRSLTKIRHREDSSLLHAPRSLFDRPSPALLKLRQELRLQRYRGLLKPTLSSSLLKPPSQTSALKPLPETDHIPDWLIQEDWAILQAIQQYQELLNLNLIILSPGHTPNWDFVADVVNMISRTYRSSKQCRNRYEAVIMPREEGKLVFDQSKKQKKNKGLYKVPQMKSGRALRTSQLFQTDNNASMSEVMRSRFEAIRSVSNRRTPTVKPLLVDPAVRNPKHAEVLADSAIDYERPLAPVEVAAKRADRIAREKQAERAQQQSLSTGGGGETGQLVLRLGQTAVGGTVNKSSAAASASAVGGILQMASSSSSGGGGVGTATPPPPVSAGPPRSSSLQGSAAALSLQEVGVRGGGSSQVMQAIAQRNSATGLVTVQGQGALASSAAAAAAQSLIKGGGGGAKTLTAAQLQLYRQQQVLARQQQLRVLQSRAAAAAAAGGGGGSSPAGSSPLPPSSPSPSSATASPAAASAAAVSLAAAVAAGQKLSVAVSSAVSPHSRTVQQMKTATSRTMSESEMVALLKRQAAKTGTTGPAALTSAQLQAALQAQQSGATGQLTAVKTSVAGLTLPQMKSALQSAGLKTSSVTPQQIRQLTLQQQQLLAQHRKVAAAAAAGQKVAHLTGQTTVGGAATGGQQTLSHSFLAGKSPSLLPSGSQQARVIPVSAGSLTQQSLKQAIQVVAGGGRGEAGGSGGSTGRGPTTQLIGTIKAGSAQHQQALLSQVSAVLQGGTVRQPVRLAAAGGGPGTPLVAVAVSQAQAHSAAGLLGLSTSPLDSSHQQQQQQQPPQ